MGTIERNKKTIRFVVDNEPSSIEEIILLTKLDSLKKHYEKQAEPIRQKLYEIRARKNIGYWFEDVPTEGAGERGRG